MASTWDRSGPLGGTQGLPGSLAAISVTGEPGAIKDEYEGQAHIALIARVPPARQ